ncbi:MAG TPA: type II secretion system protein GspM [Methylomirabilota bacterium]|nr:type II secretion system protein GspM [Methylomirabilota bacterium]
MLALRKRERTVIAAGLVLVLAVGGYVLLLEPALTRQRERADIILAREATLEGRRALVARRDRLSGELETLERQVDEASVGLLPGPTAPLAASALQKIMKDLATGSAVDVRSERVLAPQELSGVLEIPLELTVAGNIRQIVTLLARLERATSTVAVKDVKIRVAASGQPRELLATLLVAGYLRLGTSPPPSPGRAPSGDQT